MTDERVPMEVEAAMEQERPYDANDPKQVNEARKKSGRQKRKTLEFVQAMMTMPEGRKWLWQKMEIGFVFGNPIQQGDPYGTYFNLGMQNFGKMLLAETQEFPELFALMLRESKEK